MSVNGLKLRELRIEKGYSQEKLALMSNVNRRTVQRAEAGKSIAIETIAFIAEALEVQPLVIRSTQNEMFEFQERPAPTQKGEVILVPIMSGRRLIDVIRSSFSSDYLYEVEPRKDNIDLLSSIASIFQSVYFDPWNSSYDPPNLSDSKILEIQAETNSQLEELQQKEIRVFVASYGSYEKVPKMSEEGHMYTNQFQIEEYVTKVIVIVSDSDAPHLSRIQKDHVDFYEVPF